jgi:hypothetical protein
LNQKKNIGEQIVESIKKPANDSLNNQISINGLNAKLAGKEKRLVNFIVDILLACYVFPFAVGFTLGSWIDDYFIILRDIRTMLGKNTRQIHNQNEGLYS